MPELSTDVRYIKGVGEQRAKALARLGVRTLGDLLNYFPRAYEDRTAVRPIAELALDETACVRAMVAAEPRLTRVRRGLDLVKLRIVDESGSADVTFFNQSCPRPARSGRKLCLLRQGGRESAAQDVHKPRF